MLDVREVMPKAAPLLGGAAVLRWLCADVCECYVVVFGFAVVCAERYVAVGKRAECVDLRALCVGEIDGVVEFGNEVADGAAEFEVVVGVVVDD